MSNPVGMPPVAVELNPFDPFEAALIDIVTVNRRKRQDYATEKDIFSNFRFVASTCGMPSAAVAADTLVMVKHGRILSIRQNNRVPANESLEDSYLDRAVYSIIAYVLVQEETQGGGEGQAKSLEMAKDLAG